MTPKEIRDAIISYLKTNWTSTQIAWPNTSFDPSEQTPFIAPNILFGDSVLGEMCDDGVDIRTGILIIQIFTPKGSGSKTAYTYADALETLFRRIDLANDELHFFEVTTKEVGVSTYQATSTQSHDYFQLNVSASFRSFTE